MKHQNKSLWQQLLIIPVIVLIFCTISTALAQTAPQIAEKTLAATVYLEMQDSKGLPLGFGSGFFVRDNLIATNYHVIEGAARGTAKLVGKFTTYTIEGVTATDKTNDLALLKVTAPGIKPLPLGNSTDVKIGETVYVAGNPKGLEGTFSNGIISSLRDKNTKERLQMTAPISPGSSGGPVLNSKGEVIGVSFMTLVGGQNLNFAIPSRYLTELLTKSKPAEPLAQGNRSISAKTYFMWGNTKYYLGDYKGAITDYTQAIRLNPDYADAYYNRGNVKYHLGQHFAAIADYDIAIRLNPDDADAYYNRGLAKHHLGQHFAAIADYDIAIRLNPDYAKAYSSVNRGDCDPDYEHNRSVNTSPPSQIMISPSASILMMPQHTTIAELRRASSVNTLPPSQIMISPSASILIMPQHTTIAELRRATSVNTSPPSQIMISPSASILIDATAYINRGNAKSKLDQYFAAIADYDIAIRLNPDYAKGILQSRNCEGSTESHMGGEAGCPNCIETCETSRRYESHN